MKTTSSITRHINSCPVALGISRRCAVRNPQDIGKDKTFARNYRRARGYADAGSEDEGVDCPDMLGDIETTSVGPATPNAASFSNSSRRLLGLIVMSPC